MIGNLFCDASINLNTSIACAGSILVSENFNNKLDEMYCKQMNATNNSSEILAVLLGLKMALIHRYEFDSFRLFSDSKICIYGLREWCYSWINNQDRDSNLIRSDGQCVSNQDYFKNIIRMVLDNELKIEFLHQKGHGTMGEIGLEKCRKFFVETNKGLTPEALGTTIGQLSTYNNEVDRVTKSILSDNIAVGYESYYPLSYMVDKREITTYQQLINYK